MASLRNHKVVEKWKTHLDREHIYHFTKNARVVRTGILGGNAKIVYITGSGKLNCSGMGNRATVADFRRVMNDMAGWEKVV